MNPIETRYLFSTPMKVERQTLGHTPLGQRSVVVVTEATIHGPDLHAVLLSGGSDWVTEDRNRTIRLDCRLVFRTDDDELIAMTYQGRRHTPPAAAQRLAQGEAVDPTEIYHRVAVLFETAAPRYAHLNHLIAVGRARRMPDGVSATYEIFEVL